MNAPVWSETVELPERSTWLLEASAGTGKTHQIASLFLRLVAEYDLPVDRILTITFTNASTAELRDRVRARLLQALHALRRDAVPAEDVVVVHLRDRVSRASALRRLERAVRSFDLAAISTIHGFAQRMLSELAFDSGQDPELELLAQPTDIFEQIVDDTLAQVYAEATVEELAALEQAGLRRTNLLFVARAMSGPIAPRVVPEVVETLGEQLRALRDPSTASAVAPLASFARTVRERVEAELRRRHALTFDQMLSRLAEQIAAGGGADSAVAMRIRERFDAALVDEFQDTDEAQWRVLDAAFRGQRRLFLIGDPKQAIYAFRGADVHVYLEAARVVPPGQRQTMGDNWRSDPAMVDAVNALFRPTSDAFDLQDVDYVRVTARKPQRLVPPLPGLEVRWTDGRILDRGRPGEKIPRKPSMPTAQLVAREIVAWLRGERAQILDRGGPRDVQPRDLAVLVSRNVEAREVQEALARVGVPSVASSKTSIFETDVAHWVGHWLDAVAGAGRDRDARNAAVSPMFGWTADELSWALAVASGGDEVRTSAERAGVRLREWDAWTSRLRRAAERWQRDGFARTFDREATDLRVIPRLLSMPDGERHATDLRHLFELLHVEERTRRLGPAALAQWLRGRSDFFVEEYLQRLESDALAVRIETVHISKGLQYPIVFVPYGWNARAGSGPDGPMVVRGPSGPELHVGPTKAGRKEARERQAAELRREDLRKMYVAVTRAQHRTTVWYGPIGQQGVRASGTALGRLLMRDPSARGFDDARMPDFGKDAARAWATAQARLDALVARSQGAAVWVAESPPGELVPWVAPAARRAPLRTASWPEGRALVGSWRVASFTSLAKASAVPDRDEKVTPSEVLEEDRRERDPMPLDDDGFLVRPALAAFASPPRLRLGGGTQYGTWVHAVLENLDFATGRAKDGRALESLVAAHGATVGARAREEAAELVVRLPAVLATPLDGGAADPVRLPAGFALRDLSRADRLDELEFDLRLGDGTTGGPSARCVDADQVLDAILASERRPGIAAWVEHQQSRRGHGEPPVGAIRGILTGSIDLVFRTGTGADGRYFIVDYKTNRIGESEPGHYASPWLGWEMARKGYPLQSLLYTVALHRHLASRLPGYDYDRHVGGCLYLFLRGMAGPETARDPRTGRCLGVLADRWPRATIEAVDRGFAAGRRG